MHVRIQAIDDAGTVIGTGYANLDDDAVSKGKFHSTTKPREGFSGSGGKKYSGQGRGNGIYLQIGKAQIGRADKPAPQSLWPVSR